MTGSSNNNMQPLRHAPSVQSPHAPSVQWNALVEAAEKRSAMMRAQPEVWWRNQSDRLAAKWLSAGLPTTKQEEWKYTSLASLGTKARTIGIGSIDVKAPSGVRFLRLSETATDKAITSDAANSLRSLLEGESNLYFENFAKSLVVDPFVILIPDRLRSDQPIEITWNGLAAGQWAVGVAAVIVGSEAEVSLVERYGGETDAHAFTTAIEVRAGAKLSHLRLQTGKSQADQGFVFSSARVRVLANAKYETTQVSFGSRLSREDLVVDLCETGAETITDGVFIGRADQLLDHHTSLNHRVGQTTSSQIYKGVLADDSRGVFNGRIAIAKDAAGSNSSQMNKNLLLSKRVEIDTKPQLEIENDDVKAAHGAAIGRLDPEHIFYLRSRGIEAPQAVEILARGFAHEAVQRLSSPALVRYGAEEIERGLAGLNWEAL